MKQIWKFELEVTDNQIVVMPFGSKIMSLQIQKEKPCIWAVVDPLQKKEKRIIEIFGTGCDINFHMGADRKYIGTCQLYGGDLVIHVFEYTGV